MKKSIYKKDEQLIAEAILEARKIQDYLWADLTEARKGYYDPVAWKNYFQKRVDKINQLDRLHPNYIVELRKRVLQQAALSIQALKILDQNH